MSEQNLSDGGGSMNLLLKFIANHTVVFYTSLIAASLGGGVVVVHFYDWEKIDQIRSELQVGLQEVKTLATQLELQTEMIKEFNKKVSHSSTPGFDQKHPHHHRESWEGC